MRNSFRLQMESRSANEGFARVTVASFAAQADPTVDELSDVKTAVSEAVTNCIVHAYRNTVGPIYIAAQLLEDDTLRVTVRDKGCGIGDVARAMEPCFTTAPEEERSGMGFTIMETFMDKLRVTSKEGSGTRVFMEKRLNRKRR